MREKVAPDDQIDIRKFDIDVSRTEDGVWTATSDAIPGLNIEGDTFEEAVAEARAWAPELLRANNIVAEQEIYRLVFSSQIDQSVLD